jgi:hypothetical protein
MARFAKIIRHQAFITFAGDPIRLRATSSTLLVDVFQNAGRAT